MQGNLSLEQFNLQERRKINGFAIASFTLGVLGFIPWLLIFYTTFRDGIGFLTDMLFFCLCFSAPWINLATIISGGFALVNTKRWGNSRMGYLLSILGIVLGVSAIIFSFRNILLPIFSES